MMTYPVTCPTCFETFEIAIPPVAEMPAEYDYDCEVCCRPMLIILNSPEDIYAQSLAD
ncbi:MAG: CPXCG motif-containing cysteine-rich protein [Verrucomicrobiae bacterium]|nr:CPXCG motif-containing cysteine-rich protein [Verrucomicrobiae bacterium]NNJ42574.1 CPXCG motif-containing cysteine-rich protein [Akkermansiaceae bacterium]